MGAIIVQRPQELVLQVDYVKKFLHVDTAADDDRIDGLLRAAIARLDGPEGILGRALMRQTLRIDLAAWPSAGYEIPFPPLIAVTEVAYRDAAGVETVLDAASYRVISGGLQASRLVYASGLSLPALEAGAFDAVSITFDAGYESVTSPADNTVPEPLKQAIIMMVSSWYDEGVTEDIPQVVQSLVAPYCVKRFGA